MRELAAITLLALAPLPATAQVNAIDSSMAVAASYSISTPASSDMGRAVDRLRTGQYRSASTLFEPLADGSLDPAVVLMSGYAHLGAGELGRARIYFERSLQLDRASAMARHGLGLVALALGDRVAAAVQLASLDRLSRECRAQCTNSHEIEQARTSLRRTIG